MIIGLHGLPRSGKDSIANILIACGFTKRAFADPLKQAAAILLNRPLAECNGDGGFNREAILPEWGFSMRWFLQVLGTECLRAQVDDEFWVRRWAMGLNKDANTVVTDVRFENEAQAIRAQGGILIEVTRPGTVSNGHVSDKPVACDYHVANTGTLVDLGVAVFGLLENLAADLDRRLPDPGDYIEPQAELAPDPVQPTEMLPAAEVLGLACGCVKRCKGHMPDGAPVDFQAPVVPTGTGPRDPSGNPYKVPAAPPPFDPAD